MKLIALLLLIPILASADYLTYGYGVTTCGTYIDQREQDDQWEKLNAVNWLGGYLTRFSRNNEVASISTDILSSLQWIENYCEENPLRTFAYGAAILTTYLQENDLVEYVEADDTQRDEEDWTLSLYSGGATLLRLEYPSKDQCLSAGRSYFADGSVDRFDCGLKCEDSIDLTAAIRCEQVCNTEGCR